MAQKKTKTTPRARRSRKRGWLRNFASGLFSTLLAPILVGVVLQAYQAGSSSRAPEKPEAFPVAASASPASPGPTTAARRAVAPRRDDRHPILDALARIF